MHRQERMRLYQGQEERWNAEAKERSERLNHGLRGLFDRLSGKAKAIQQRNEIEARACADRDREQRDFMAIEQMKERIALRDRFQSMKDRQKCISVRKRLILGLRRFYAHSRQPKA